MCPAGETLNLCSQGEDKHGNQKVFFQGRVSQCKHCNQKNDRMNNPAASDKSNGHGRQVSFIKKYLNRNPILPTG